ncbi:MAG: hypothetical protein KA185_09225 [Vitreoscilla sp.]|nr:hypothetical protein [Vitreoscilla sp.]
MTPRQFIATALATATLVFSCAAQAQDRAEVAPSQIIGNRELPKVIYIVPWKKPAPDPLTGRPPVSVLDEALAPLDRDVFRRQLAYSAASPNANAATPTKPAAATPVPQAKP